MVKIQLAFFSIGTLFTSFTVIYFKVCLHFIFVKEVLYLPDAVSSSDSSDESTKSPSRSLLQSSLCRFDLGWVDSLGFKRT